MLIMKQGRNQPVFLVKRDICPNIDKLHVHLHVFIGPTNKTSASYGGSDDEEGAADDVAIEGRGCPEPKLAFCC